MFSPLSVCWFICQQDYAKNHSNRFPPNWVEVCGTGLGRRGVYSRISFPFLSHLNIVCHFSRINAQIFKHFFFFRVHQQLASMMLQYCHLLELLNLRFFRFSSSVQFSLESLTDASCHFLVHFHNDSSQVSGLCTLLLLFFSSIMSFLYILNFLQLPDACSTVSGIWQLLYLNLWRTQSTWPMKAASFVGWVVRKGQIEMRHLVNWGHLFFFAWFYFNIHVWLSWSVILKHEMCCRLLVPLPLWKMVPAQTARKFKWLHKVHTSNMTSVPTLSITAWPVSCDRWSSLCCCLENKTEGGDFSGHDDILHPVFWRETCLLGPVTDFRLHRCTSSQRLNSSSCWTRPTRRDNTQTCR